MTSHSLPDATESPIRLLLVEDNEQDAEFIAMMLQRSRELSVSVDQANSLGQAIEHLEQNTYDIVLLDLGLPDSFGTDSVVRIRESAPHVPVVVLTGDDRGGTAIAAIDSGAQDYLSKHHLVGQLLSRVVQHSIARNSRLMRAQSEALVDSLTGLANRRACDEELSRRMADFKRHGHAFCVALFDIDHFKQINDNWGHQTGDQVLKEVATVLVRNSRETDHVGRFGGEEFVITFPMTDLSGAEQVVKKCHRAVSELEVGEQPIRVTISAGYAEIKESEESDSLIARADKALYAAKISGRDRVMSHSSLEGLNIVPHDLTTPVVWNI